ncbi:MAG: hypothetical protein LUE27_11025 [Clostridia bacterium]|nr:hypothetical protein [Clostridia bacterium]
MTQEQRLIVIDHCRSYIESLRKVATEHIVGIQQEMANRGKNTITERYSDCTEDMLAMILDFMNSIDGTFQKTAIKLNTAFWDIATNDAEND